MALRFKNTFTEPKKNLNLLMMAKSGCTPAVRLSIILRISEISAHIPLKISAKVSQI